MNWSGNVYKSENVFSDNGRSEKIHDVPKKVFEPAFACAQHLKSCKIHNTLSLQMRSNVM